MPSIESDLSYLRAGADALQDYLLSNDIFWPIGAPAPAGEPPLPQLTLGGMLLAQARLLAKTGSAKMSSQQQVELTNLEERLNAARGRWRVAWENKAGKEYGARLNLWRNFLNEYRENPENNAGRYSYEVSRRVQLQLLGKEGAITPEQGEMLKGLDLLLKGIFQPGGFIWDDELAGGFPPETYWYLYGRLRKGKTPA